MNVSCRLDLNLFSSFLFLFFFFFFSLDKVEDSFEDVNTTAFNLRKNLIDTLLTYTSVNTTNSSGNTRGRAIFNQYDNMLDLVFVLDASTSVTREKFQLGLRFVKKLVKFLGTNSTRYGLKVNLSLCLCSGTWLVCKRETIYDYRFPLFE